MAENPLASDLDHVLVHTEGLWDAFRGRRLFITGGTGFFGCWLLESLCWAHDRFDLGATAVVLTRNPAAFRAKAPHLANHPAVRLHLGDVRTFAFPAGEFSHVIHAATEATVKSGDATSLALFDTIVQGTRHTLDFAVRCGARQFLFCSSGAVYGRQPPELSHLSEDYPGAPDPMDMRSAYGEGKRAAEMLCTLYQKHHGVETKIARGFAFVGPYLPLDAHFAIGNFIRDALAGGPILVKGDGTPYRSYLYAADLAIWLWTILLRGAPGRAFNVGSETAITIAALAHAVGQIPMPTLPVHTAGVAMPGQPPERYVPAVGRARAELGLEPWVALPDAIRRMAHWYSGSHPRVQG